MLSGLLNGSFGSYLIVSAFNGEWISNLDSPLLIREVGKTSNMLSGLLNGSFGSQFDSIGSERQVDF